MFFNCYMFLFFLYCKDTTDINICQTDNYYHYIDKIYQHNLTSFITILLHSYIEKKIYYTHQNIYTLFFKQ